MKKIMKSVMDSTDLGKHQQLHTEWLREVDVQIAMRQAEHKNVIEFIGAVERGYDRYLMFRWAEEGNLRTFWRTNSRPALTTALVKDVVYQIIGLVDALQKLHTGSYRTGGESFRHGDLKPENILCVTIKPPQTDGGINIPELKISGMGLAKYHSVATEFRPPTSMRYTTARYEPPEVLSPGQRRSRRYDMWSLGCIILETVIWLLYGNQTLEIFNEKIVDKSGLKTHWFGFEQSTRPGDHRSRVSVHCNIQDTMQALSKDQECDSDTAMRDLLEIVRAKLLVVELGAAIAMGAKSGTGRRITSYELSKCLQEMAKKGETNEHYWFTGKSRQGVDRLIAAPDSKSLGQDARSNCSQSKDKKSRFSCANKQVTTF